ncbi:MAG: SpoIID/LytB domain-containing protein [Oscillospiraceae bacterium]|jgi:stage II sporulation protein D|nr:SpoIID/LytB domain-containing protein [Oscillospiraceae bacterium]
MISAKKTAKITAAALAILLLMTLCPTKVRAYSPPNDTVRIGLYYGATALQAANLQNVDGYGGFEFGYFDPDTRAFISIGATTGETKISMLRDRNMYYKSDGNTYVTEAVSDIIIGCFHVQLPGSYNDFYGADSVARGYGSGFVKYDNGVFVACVGDYTTRSRANEEAAALGGSVTEGTQYTIAVAATGTGRVLFEFDGGSSRALGVRPLDVNSKTWFKQHQYYGAFQYYRQDGQDLRVLNFISVDDYIKGVLPQEMSPTWPLEALKAQAVTARTYALSKLGSHGGSGFDLCTTEHCQAYIGVSTANDMINRAVNETSGEYVTYNGELCETYYSSSDGGSTENSENVWAQARPYLRGVVDPYEQDVANSVSQYFWTVKYTPSELTTRMKGRGINCGTITSLTVSQYTENGNVFAVTMKDTNGKSWTFKKDEARIALGARSLRFTIGGGTQPGVVPIQDRTVYANSGETVSDGALYAVGADGEIVQLPAGDIYAATGTGEITTVGAPAPTTESSADGKIDGVFVLSGTGNGHNVGMSQWGAYAMAQRGMTYRDIIHFYYTDVEIG